MPEEYVKKEEEIIEEEKKEEFYLVHRKEEEEAETFDTGKKIKNILKRTGGLSQGGAFCSSVASFSDEDAKVIESAVRNKLTDDYTVLIDGKSLIVTKKLAAGKEQKMQDELRLGLDKAGLSPMVKDMVALSTASTWANKTEVAEYKPHSFAYSEEIKGSIPEINTAIASAQCVATWDVSEETMKIVNVPIMASKELDIKVEEIKQVDQYHYEADVDYAKVSPERIDGLNKRLTLLNTGYLVNVEGDRWAITCLAEELERKKIEKRHADDIAAALAELILSGEESVDILFSMPEEEQSKIMDILKRYGFVLEIDPEKGTLRIRKRKKKIKKKKEGKEHKSKDE